MNLCELIRGLRTSDATLAAALSFAESVGCLYGYDEVELLGPPQLRDGIERTVAVLVMPPQQAVWLLADKGRAWEADLYRLAAERRAAAVSQSDQR